jgi:hypothetical protein
MFGLEALTETFLDDFYVEAGVDWRTVLEGEALRLAVTFTETDGKVNSLTFLADGVRQVAAPVPFDSKHCARALKQALDAHKGVKK